MVTKPELDKALAIYLCGVEGAEQEDPLRQRGDESGAPSGLP